MLTFSLAFVIEFLICTINFISYFIHEIIDLQKIYKTRATTSCGGPHRPFKHIELVYSGVPNNHTGMLIYFGEKSRGVLLLF